MDIFDRLNSLNTSMQGRDANIWPLADKVCAFTGKLDLWHDWLVNKNVDMFATFSNCAQETGMVNIFSLIHTINVGLKQQFGYFSDDYTSFPWVRDPFSYPGKDQDVEMEVQLIELESDIKLRSLCHLLTVHILVVDDERIPSIVRFCSLIFHSIRVNIPV